jgi:hypothetical protein
MPMATGYDSIGPILLLDAQTTSENGVWFLVGKWMSPSITVEGLEAGGSIQIRVYNGYQGTFPSNSEMGVAHSTLGNITADIGASLGASYTYIRAIKTAGGSPTATTVIAQAQQPR